MLNKEERVQRFLAQAEKAREKLNTADLCTS